VKIELPREGWRSVTIPVNVKKLLEKCSEDTEKSESEIATEAITIYCNRKELDP